jgi:7-cyano-7-deazaguanine synthase
MVLANMGDVPMRDRPALVLLSGGQDSTTCLFWAKKHFKEVRCLNVDYGQRHQVELDAAFTIAGMADVKYRRFRTDIIKNIGDSALVDDKLNVKMAHRGDDNLPASFVPGRNIMLLTIAAMYAYKHDIVDIVIGVCQTDYSGYPDCRESFITKYELALSKGVDRRMNIHTPLMFLSKKQTVEMAAGMMGCMEALAFSHTCYEGKVPPCGDCPSCKIRLQGFEDAGIMDPLVKRTETE